MSKYTWTHVDDLTPWVKNPRKNDLAAVKVADSIRRFGFPSPIITWNGQVVAGHTRLKAIKLVLDENPAFVVRDAPGPGFVPVVEHPFASQREADAYAIADNRLGADAQWDFDLLRDILADLDGDAMSTGFTEDEIRMLVSATEWTPPEITEDLDDDAKPDIEDGQTIFVPQDLIDMVHRKTPDMKSAPFLACLRHIIEQA
jgi:ParB-like chromosome segregation protein Spo0J